MSSIACRQAFSETLLELAQQDDDVIVLVSDSRGSAALGQFAKALPDRLVEVGIAEQNIVGIAAGLASCGKKPFVVSPASFLTMRSIEQIKNDVAYSNANVKLIGISGGVSYGALGMTHHSLQDIAVTRAIPNLTVILPADGCETKRLTESLVGHIGPVYVRLGRNPVDSVYESDDWTFEIGRTVTLRNGSDLTFLATGETVKIAVDAAEALSTQGLDCRVLNVHTIKPLDEEAILAAAKETQRVITVEEHSKFGGLGSAVAELLSEHYPVPIKIVAIDDEPPVTGNQQEIFRHYGLTVENLVRLAHQMQKVVM